jgi:hypothetical protein
LAFTPSIPLFGGNIRPALGGSFTPDMQTSWASTPRTVSPPIPIPGWTISA